MKPRRSSFTTVILVSALTLSIVRPAGAAETWGSNTSAVLGPSETVDDNDGLMDPGKLLLIGAIGVVAVLGGISYLVARKGNIRTQAKITEGLAHFPQMPIPESARVGKARFQESLANKRLPGSVLFGDSLAVTGAISEKNFAKLPTPPTTIKTSTGKTKYLGHPKQFRSEDGYRFVMSEGTGPNGTHEVLLVVNDEGGVLTAAPTTIRGRTPGEPGPGPIDPTDPNWPNWPNGGGGLGGGGWSSRGGRMPGGGWGGGWSMRSGTGVVVGLGAGLTSAKALAEGRAAKKVPAPAVGAKPPAKAVTSAQSPR